MRWLKVLSCDYIRKGLSHLALFLAAHLNYDATHSPSQNGIAERLNKYLIERLISVCKAKKIPLFLWPQLIQAIAHIKNRSYNSIIEKTPYEALYNKKPNINHIRILGSLTFVLKNKREYKLIEKSDIGILVGFESVNNFIFGELEVFIRI